MSTVKRHDDRAMMSLAIARLAQALGVQLTLEDADRSDTELVTMLADIACAQDKIRRRVST